MITVLKGKSEQLHPQCQCSDLNNHRIVAAEQGDDSVGCRETDHTEHQKDNGTYADTEPAGFLHTVIKPSAEAVAANRLEALTKAYDNGVDKEHKAADNGHGCNGCIPVRLAHKV